RVMGKKKPEELAKNFVLFQEGAKKKGFSDEAIQALWDVLVPFAGYAFNKAHSSAYGLVTYWTAYLKANYPAEYMAALLTSVKDDKDKSAVYLNECRRMKIKVLPPDVNESVHNFAAQSDDVILFGLEAVRNVGTNVVESIIRARKAKGKFSSFPDYLDKIEAQACNKRTTESLIKAGAFDALGHTRKGLTAHYEPMIDNVVAVKRKEAEGQFDLFGGMGDDNADEPGFGLDIEFTDEEWDKTYLLAQEREMLGLYVSDHPLFGLEHVLSDKADAGIGQLTGGDFGDGAVVTVGGIISGLQRKMTKQGNAWAIATVEDLAGSIECMFFPATYQLVSTQLVEDAVVFVKGRLDKREDIPRLVAMELQVPDLSNAGTNAPVIITIPAVKVTPPMVSRLGEVLDSHRGNSEVRIKLQGPRKTTVLRLDRHRVQPDPSLFGDLKVLLGASCLAG
ncbi:DNA polymerase III subunit alpha, partial [Streptomyces sp. CAI-21]|nr:DNA polymerase III subunit alpha [Streptomyces sp. CAI-21]